MKDNKQYHGYLALPRHSKMIRQDLGHHLFNLYIALVMDARWHRKNPQIGCVIGTQTEIASQLGISQSSLSRGLDGLIKKDQKYVIKHSRYLMLGYFPLFLTDVAGKMFENDYANLHELYAYMHRINAELQDNYAKSQEKRSQNAPQRIYRSSNDNLSSSQGSRDELDIDEINKGIESAKGNNL